MIETLTWLQNSLSQLWNSVVGVLPTVGDICLFFITSYTFYITFISKRMKVLGIQFIGSHFESDSISFVIENKTLSAIAIETVNLYIDNQYMWNIAEYPDFLLLEPFKVVTVKSQPYSKLTPCIKFNLGEVGQSNLMLEVKTSRGIQFIKATKGAKKSKVKRAINEGEIQKIQAGSYYYNGKLIPRDTRYVAVIDSPSQPRRTIIVKTTGVMSESINGFNMLRQDHLKSPEILERAIYDIMDSDKDVSVLIHTIKQDVIE